MSVTKTKSFDNYCIKIQISFITYLNVHILITCPFAQRRNFQSALKKSKTHRDVKAKCVKILRTST